jgi:hypothetical protein
MSSPVEGSAPAPTGAGGQVLVGLGLHAAGGLGVGLGATLGGPEEGGEAAGVEGATGTTLR